MAGRFLSNSEKEECYMSKSSFSYQPAQADKTDYLFSVLCVVSVLNLLTLPLTVLVAIFWIKKYQLSFLGEGFSKTVDGKKLVRILLLLLSGAGFGTFGWVLEERITQAFPVLAVPETQESSLPLVLLVGFASALITELAFRRCLYSEWSKYGIFPAIVGIGVISMLLSKPQQWFGILALSLGAAVIYETTHCVVMTTVFHVGYLWMQSLLSVLGQTNLSTVIGAVALAAGVVLLIVFLKLSPDWEKVKTKIKIQQQDRQKHPYVFRASYNFFVVVLVLFQTTPLWYSKFFS